MENQNVIKIDGKHYDANDFSAEQKYAVAQIQSLQAKQTEQKMLLDQTQVALQFFTNRLIESLKKSRDQS